MFLLGGFVWRCVVSGVVLWRSLCCVVFCCAVLRCVVLVVCCAFSRFDALCLIVMFWVESCCVILYFVTFISDLYGSFQ